MSAPEKLSIGINSFNGVSATDRTGMWALQQVMFQEDGWHPYIRADIHEAEITTLKQEVERLPKAIISLLGNAHFNSTGDNASRIYGGLLEGIRELAQAALEGSYEA